MSGPSCRHHLLISGTGRAGTSFLVRLLTEVGLDTTLARMGGAAHWDEHAEAGLEQAPLISGDADLPYVIKSPAAAEILSAALADRSVAIDALILPMRGLAEAAASRCVLEARALHEHQPWRSTLDAPASTHGTVAGGILYSLHPLDQARILATAFHDLMLVAAEAEIPVYPVAFPRMTQDWQYLWRAIRPALPDGVERDRFEAAHRTVAAAGRARLEDELAGRADAKGAADVPSLADIDNIALRREIRRLRKELDAKRTDASRADDAS